MAALLEAGAAVVAERGFRAATMTEIAARAKAPIGSLYRFFPSKEVLADALLQRYGELIDDAFGRIDAKVGSMPIAALADALLDLMPAFHREKRAIRALLEEDPDGSTKRESFRGTTRRHIAKTLLRRCPTLAPRTAEHMAVVLIQNMKMGASLPERLRGEALSGALAELREMTRLYLVAKLGG